MSLSEAQVQAAAQQLWRLQSRQQTGNRLAADLRPGTPLDGWRIQQQVSALRGTPVRGWKCALPPADRWVVAALHQVWPSGAMLPAPPGATLRIEPEWAFELGHDLPPRAQPYTPAEVDAAVGRTRLALEILACRYNDPALASGPELMADSLWQHGLVLGDEINLPAGQPLPSDFMIKLTVERQPVFHLAARHPDGNPRLALYWLAEFLRQQGLGLVAGQVVITGSLAGVIALPFTRSALLDFGGLGTVEIPALPPPVSHTAAPNCFT